MQDSILKFSNEELAAIKDRNFFQLKHSSTKKIVDLFGDLEKELKTIAIDNDLNVEGLNVSAGKIFRGENYNLYPYVLLDYPRLFTTESIFAFRTMFWWGSGFSFTLHLQGKALDQFRSKLVKDLGSLIGKEVYYCVGKTPWQYHYEKENYILLSENSIDDITMMNTQNEFMKLSRRLDIDHFSLVKEKGIETFNLFYSLLK